MKDTGLYSPSKEHSSCGVGFTANIQGVTSRETVEDGLGMIERLVHRGGMGSDGISGDGAGILLGIPHKFFSSVMDFKLPEEGKYGVAFLFLPLKEKKKKTILDEFSRIIKEEKGSVIAFREVPVNTSCLGQAALESMPGFIQAFVEFPSLSGNELERKIYLARKQIEEKARQTGFSPEDFYIASFSSLTIVYKGMLAGRQLREFYPDLESGLFQSAFAVIHQRYSTNTFPSWPLSQPFRHIAHNGEINTIKGNINYMKARQSTLSSDLFKEDIKKLLPVIEEGCSDSAAFDSVFELLLKAGRGAEHVMMMMVPEAFGDAYHMSEARRAFCEYHSAFQEPWDGPAALVFTDGVKVGAALDRNGLRPLRYFITSKDKIVMASESGLVDADPAEIVEKGRLGPGKMLVVDTARSSVKKDSEIKSSVSRRRPYGRWIKENKIELKGLLQPAAALDTSSRDLQLRQKLFGYTLEDLNTILAPMARHAQEPVGSMGDDQQPAALSEKPHILFRYFKQLFAQVTNPPIDPYRENLVMSLMSFIGEEKNLLEENPLHCRQLKLAHPVLTNQDIEKILYRNAEGLGAERIKMLFPLSGSASGLEKAIEEICRQAEKKVDEGSQVLILSDRDVNEKNVPVPSLLAVSAVSRHLTEKGKRHLVGLVVESGEPKEVGDFALLVSFGASAVNPYLALETVSSFPETGMTASGIKQEDALDNYINAVKKGILKIMSKMGISTIRSYKFAQIFEAVGLSSRLTEKYFPEVETSIEGINIEDIAAGAINRHNRAYGPGKNNILESGGRFRYRKNLSKHLVVPETIVSFRRAVQENNWDEYMRFSDLTDSSGCTLRSHMEFKKRKSIPLEEVEGEDSIIKRFYSSAMSLGSISKEAHETIARAMNFLGCASNSGEGGEDKKRYATDSVSAVKQVASGRFGVDIDYLVSAGELQIKMAQGAKPGEGGQLPGDKVDEAIARVRNSTPGVMLISPPPHHDIYSIEDLAQLIYDLKSANTSARVSVKLVSESGVGTVAAGVAKAGADMVLISGGEGGTGAAPLSSVKGAGTPWEIGLSETRQTLELNSLRSRIRIQVDGQIRTGRDIVVGALLGAEEFGFGTAALMAMGCVMVRHCHSNTCPVGVATQDGRLRKKFKGKEEYLINYMRFVARHTRQLMACLGFRKFDDMVGRSAFLAPSEATKAKGLDFSRLLADTKSVDKIYDPAKKTRSEESLNRRILKDSSEALKKKIPLELRYDIKNSDRAVGSTLSGAIARRWGGRGLEDDSIKIFMSGFAGQSFGAFLARGITLFLQGDTNDYLAKGLSGGKIIVRPEENALFRASENIIAGNVSLFGATGGEVYINGIAGERFAARNSGASAVVEGVGDHGCEYMTAGTVVVLGYVGVNFAAGMSGGIAYVYDPEGMFDTKCNLEMVEVESVNSEEDRIKLMKMIEKHHKLTQSLLAKNILDNFFRELSFFVKVFPLDYKKALERIKKKEERDSEREVVTEEVY